MEAKKILFKSTLIGGDNEIYKTAHYVCLDYEGP